eukprot:COSAG06_NODE_42803_length_378_cov_0.921147_1_plen_34_part_01
MAAAFGMFQTPEPPARDPKELWEIVRRDIVAYTV